MWTLTVYLPVSFDDIDTCAIADGIRQKFPEIYRYDLQFRMTEGRILVILADEKNELVFGADELKLNILRFVRDTKWPLFPWPER